MGGPNKICETFGKKRAHYGLTDVGKRRWCAGCANKQPGETTEIGAKMCETLRGSGFPAAGLTPANGATRIEIQVGGAIRSTSTWVAPYEGDEEPEPRAVEAAHVRALAGDARREDGNGLGLLVFVDG